MKSHYILLTIVLSAPYLNAATTCASLKAVSLPHTTIRYAAPTDATTMLGPGGVLVKTPEFCRVAGVIKPSADSDIHFEVWLPTTTWNGRFRGTGNGGFAGSLNYAEMAAAIRDGYATATTDTGHRADGIDAAWALGHPEKITDFGYRAIHEMTVDAKAVAKAFYGDAPKHSYFSSCSNGGRQALMEAQRFPEDYDGILAGAPANDWTHLMIANFYDVGKIMDETPARYLPGEKIPAIANAVLKACDAADGLTDGIVSVPPACHFDPATIVCKGPETKNCLTAPQAETLRHIYAGAHTSDGASIYPGYEPGGEDGPGGWAAWITGSKPGTSAGGLFAMGFLRNMVFSDSSWTYRGTNLANTLDTADTKMAPVLNATDANLKPFQSRGGKLILYHGWSDAAIPARNAIAYYDTVAKTMGTDTANFVRLYMVPGMQHCFGGPGPNLFGQFAVFAPGDAQHDVFTSLVDWVEKDAASSAIVATKYSQDNPTKEVEMTRPLCPYPLVAQYTGKGDSKRAENFVCEAAKTTGATQQ